MIPYSDHHAHKPHGAGLRREDRYDYDSDSESYHSSDDREREQAKLRNRKLLYTGLACVATIAAGNNIYQSTKAHHARRKQVEEGKLEMGEAMKMRRKALVLDLASVGVAAVGLNNVRMGWNRVQALK